MDLPRTNEDEYKELLGQVRLLSQTLLLAVKPHVNKHKNGLVLLHGMIWMHTILLHEMLDETPEKIREAMDYTGFKMSELMESLIERDNKKGTDEK